MTRLEILHADLVLLALVVDVAMLRHLWLILVLEESVMQDLIVDIDFSHLRLHTLSHFLFQSLGFVSFRSLLPKLRDSSLLNEFRQLKWNFVDASFILEVAALLSPVSWYGHRITHLFALEEIEWVPRRHIPGLHKVGTTHLHLQVEDLHLSLQFTLLFRHFRLSELFGFDFL